MTAVTILLLKALLLAMAALLAIAMVLGLAVAIRPALLERLQQTSDQRYSMRRATRSLDIPRNVDRWFYRHHRAYGAAVVLLALFLLSFIAFGSSGDVVAGLFPRRYQGLGVILMDFSWLVMWVLGLCSLLVGVVVFIRPSALKRWEHRANRWLTLRRVTRDLEHEYSAPGEWVRRFPRTWGLVIAVASAICIVALILHSFRVVQWVG